MHCVRELKWESQNLLFPLLQCTDKVSWFVNINRIIPNIKGKQKSEVLNVSYLMCFLYSVVFAYCWLPCILRMAIAKQQMSKNILLSPVFQTVFRKILITNDLSSSSSEHPDIGTIKVCLFELHQSIQTFFMTVFFGLWKTLTPWLWIRSYKLPICTSKVKMVLWLMNMFLFNMISNFISAEDNHEN